MKTLFKINWDGKHYGTVTAKEKLDKYTGSDLERLQDETNFVIRTAFEAAKKRKRKQEAMK
jgi:hypothetical protein